MLSKHTAPVTTAPNATCSGSESMVVTKGSMAGAHEPAAGELQHPPGRDASGSEGIPLPSEGSSL